MSYIVNSRPIEVSILTEDDYHPITPNNLLLGRAVGYNQEEDITEANPDVLADPNRLLTSQEQLCEK